MIKIALIGCGYWGTRVLKAILMTPGLELAAVYDKDPERLDWLRLTYADSFFYADSYQQLLKDKSIDALALTVSTGAHFKLAEQALTAGKHIFIEKPFTRTLAEAERLYQLAKEKDLRIHVDHIMIYHPAVRKMKDLLEQNYLGEICYMDMRRSSFGGARSDVSVLEDLAVHDLSIIDYLTDGAEPAAVYALGEKLGYPHPAIAFMLLKYQGFSANLTASWVSPAKERRIVLGGRDKTLIFDEIAAPGQLVMYDNHNPDDHIILQLEEGNALIGSLAHFCACVKTGTQSLTDARSAIRIIRILTEGKAS